MSDFQEGFFRDLWNDMLLNESYSVLCCYFREEKKQHISVKIRKYYYERTAVYGPESISYDLLKEISKIKKDEIQRAQSIEKKKDKQEKSIHQRKSSKEHACVEMLCQYYDFKTEYLTCYNNKDIEGMAKCTRAFLDVLYQKTDKAKAAKKKKNQILKEICTIKNLYKNGTVENVLNQVMNLYLYAEAAQFLYNAGYPLPQEDSSKEDTDEMPKLKKLSRARIKTVPLKMLDYYFKKREISFEHLDLVSRMSPSWILSNEVLKEKLEEVYEFACDNDMKRAVIPLMINNASGSGLYIIGKNYLQSWSTENRNQQKVEEILDGRPCCYAIVKFLNLELEDYGQYFWAPYSIVDMVYGKCDTNPEGILFNDLEKALNIYRGQLQVSSDKILYENFRNENIVHLKENAVSIDPEFRKYFKISEEEEDLREEITNYEMEYKKRLSRELGKNNCP